VSTKHIKNIHQKISPPRVRRTRDSRVFSVSRKIPLLQPLKPTRECVYCHQLRAIVLSME